jgi:hypothetical protein
MKKAACNENPALIGWLLGLLLTLLFIPAPTFADISRPGSEKGPTDVTLEIYILDIDGIDTANQNFEANVYYQAEWLDPRLAHGGREKKSYPLSEVWNPRIQILNQQRLWKTFPEIVEVSGKGEVTYRQRVWGAFSQPLRLHDFPFDRQRFAISLVAAGYNPEEVQVVGSIRSGISEQLSVADWQVLGQQSSSDPMTIANRSNSLASYQFSFDAKRKSGYFVVKVILPLVFIVMMSWVVFWIDPKESGSQISVAVTSMLTLIAYRFAVGANMPQLSYLTRLDYFILGSTILVFASLVEVVITSSYAKIGKIKRAQRIDVWCRVIFPGSFILLALESLVFNLGL